MPPRSAEQMHQSEIDMPEIQDQEVSKRRFKTLVALQSLQAVGKDVGLKQRANVQLKQCQRGATCKH